MNEELLNKDFILLWIGRSVSHLGNGAGYIAVMWWVQTETGSAMALGSLAMVNGLVATLLGPLGGVVADRYSRKAIIVLSDVMRGLVYLVLFWLAWTDNLTLSLLFVGSACSTAGAAFFGPAVTAALPQIVPHESLDRANGLNRISQNVVNIAGYAAGGVLVAFLGIPVLMLVDGISFLLSALSESFIVLPGADVREDEEPKVFWQTMLADAKEGFLYLQRQPVLFSIMKLAMVLNFVTAPIFVLFPKFVNDYLGMGSDVYGYLLSSQMAGALVGTLILSLTPWVKENLWVVKWGLTGQGVLLFSLPFLPKAYWSAHAAVFILSGCLNSVVNVYFTTIMQRITDSEYRGKVFGLLNTMSGALQPISRGLTGVVASVLSIPVIYSMASGGLALSGISFATLRGVDEFLQGRRVKTKTASGHVAD